MVKQSKSIITMSMSLFGLIMIMIFVLACDQSSLWDIATEPDYATGISVNKNSLEMTIGQSERLFATVSPSYANDLTVLWTSSDSSIAEISNTGEVRAIRAGSVQIFAWTGNRSHHAVCDVVVLDEYSGSISVSVDYSGSLGVVSSVSPIVIALSTNSFDNGIQWYGSIVSSGGVYVFTGLKPGDYQLAALFDINNDFESEKEPDSNEPIQFYENSISINDLKSIRVNNTNVSVAMSLSDTFYTDYRDSRINFAAQTITIDGNFDEWASVSTAIIDNTNESGVPDENDIFFVKAAKDSNFYYFMVEVEGSIPINAGFSYNLVIQYPRFSSTHSYESYAARITFNALFESSIYGYPGDVLLFGPDASLVFVGNGLNSNRMEIAVPKIQIESPDTINDVFFGVWNGSSNLIDQTDLFGEL